MLTRQTVVVASKRLPLRSQLRGGEAAKILSNYALLSDWISICKARAGENRRRAAGLKERNGASRQCERCCIVWVPDGAFEAPAWASRGDCLAPGVSLMANITQSYDLGDLYDKRWGGKEEE